MNLHTSPRSLLASLHVVFETITNLMSALLFPLTLHQKILAVKCKITGFRGRGMLEIDGLER
jgi:hypothetical protein